MSCNVAWDATECKGGIGWVLQNYRGELISINGRIVQ